MDDFKDTPGRGNHERAISLAMLGYWRPWFNATHWCHYGVPGSPSENVWMVVPDENATFTYFQGSVGKVVRECNYDPCQWPDCRGTCPHPR